MDSDRQSHLKYSLLWVIALLAALLSSGCSLLASSAGDTLAQSVAAGIQNADDPETVRQGLPAYLIMMDGFIHRSPDNQQMLEAAATLNSAYAGQFVNDPQRSQRLSQKALDYGLRAVCQRRTAACGIRTLPVEEFQTLIDGLDKDDVPAFYALSSAWAGWIQAHSSDWNAIAELNRVTAIMQRIVVLDENYQQGSAHLYLGVLATLVPPAMGGRPEEGQAHFERAIALSEGRNLMAKTLYARHYARMMFEKALHDRLLNEVLNSNPRYPDLTLNNILAQQLAEQLLADTDDYF